MLRAGFITCILFNLFISTLSSGILGKIMNGIKTNILEFVSQFLLLITSHLPSRLMPAASPHTDDLESPSPEPQPSPSNTTSESKSPPSPASLSAVRELLPRTISESQRNNIEFLETTLLGFCFGAAFQIATQCKQVAESEINNSISLLSLGAAAILSSLFTSHFIGEKMPNASRVLVKFAFFLAATTCFFAIATPCPLGIKCAIWALYIISLIAIATCNFL